jgi:tetratricopeptide (TPR) repeat protein
VESALIHHRAGRLDEAELLYREALATDDRNFDALHMLGVVHLQRGRNVEAVEMIEGAVRVAPRNHTAHRNLGIAYQSSSRLDDAVASLRKAVALQPEWDEAHNSLGTMLHAAGRVDEAEGSFRKAVQLNPSNPDTVGNLGRICKEVGRLDDAIACFRKVLELRPNDVGTLVEAGSAHAMRGDLDEAETYYRAALQVDAARFDAMCNLGDTLRRLDRLDEAESFARRALALRPDEPDALNTLACILLRTSALDEAEICCRKALSIRNDSAPTQITLGNILNARHRWAEADPCFRTALRLQPKSATARYNLSMLRMLNGDYEEGLKLYESRFDVLLEDFGVTPTIRELLNDARRWQGEDLRGRRLLVWTEQGFGDSLMVLRYLPMLKDRGAGELIVLCERELERVVCSVSGLRDFRCAQSVPREAFDVHCPIMSLPFLLHMTPESTPCRVPYVSVPEELSETWNKRLSPAIHPRIGLAWAGSNSLHDDRRSISLATFRPLLKAGAAQFISLQKGAGAEQAGAWQGEIEDWMDDCDDFLDTAALISSLDLVISIDTAVVHLAGALGKPVWLLNRYGSDWRWGLESAHSPWYPSVRIFRQREARDWHHVIEQVSDALIDFVPARRLIHE